MVYVSLRQIPQQDRQLSRAPFPVVSQKCKLLWSRGFWVAATGNRWLARLALAPECFSQEVAQMTSPPMSLDTITHMALPNFKRLGSMGKLMAVKWAIRCVSDTGNMAASEPLNWHGKERKQVLTTCRDLCTCIIPFVLHYPSYDQPHFSHKNFEPQRSKHECRNLQH